MGNIKIKVNDIAELVELYNPFGFKDERGRIMVFRTYDEAYYELILRVYKAGPIMVDAILFIVDNLGMSLTEAKRFFGTWSGYIGVNDPVFLFDWKNGGKGRDTQLEKIARGMHLISETKFNADMFRNALDRFKSTLNCNV